MLNDFLNRNKIGNGTIRSENDTKRPIETKTTSYNLINA